MGPRSAAACARRHAYEADPQGFVERGRTDDLLATSKGRLWWRRLYASPVGGPIVGGDPYRRRFHGHLRHLIMWRTRQCRDPFCEAPIRHIDHIQRYTDNGLTIFPMAAGNANAATTPARCPAG